MAPEAAACISGEVCSSILIHFHRLTILRTGRGSGLDARTILGRLLRGVNTAKLIQVLVIVRSKLNSQFPSGFISVPTLRDQTIDMLVSETRPNHLNALVAASKAIRAME